MLANLTMVFQLGPYRIVRELPQEYGGSAYEGVDQAHSRRVMLMQCPTTWATEEILRRLEAAAKTFALLNHPNIAKVFGFVRRDEDVYLVTEFVQGATLKKILDERRRMPPPLAITLFRQIMAGLATAHRARVVHGDLNPANVVVPDFGPVKILNLAFAHAFRQGSRVAGNAPSPYLAPEQLRGESPDVRSDIYSLGVMLYEAIFGEAPSERRARSATGSPDPDRFIPPAALPASSDAAKSIDGLLSRMLDPDPAGRFPSIPALTRFLDSAAGDLANSELSVVNSSRLPAALRRRPHSSKRYIDSLVSPKRVSAAGFLVLIAAEMFLFRSENVSELMENGLQSRPSLNQSADPMLSRSSIESARLASEPAPETTPPIATRKTVRRVPRAIDEVSSPVESAPVPVERVWTRPARETSAAQENLSLSPPQRRAMEGTNLSNLTRQTKVAPAEIINREEPDAREPGRTTHAPAPRLKVEWEN